MEQGSPHMYLDNPYLLNTTAMAKKNRFKDVFYVFLEMSHMMDIESTFWFQPENHLRSSHLPETKSNFAL